MAFVFTLKTLLRLREIHEQAELQSLQAVGAQRTSVRTEIESLDASTEEMRQQMCRDSLAGLSGAELHFHTQREWARERNRQALAEKLLELEKALQAQQNRYLEARRQRETLSDPSTTAARRL